MVQRWTEHILIGQSSVVKVCYIKGEGLKKEIEKTNREFCLVQVCSQRLKELDIVVSVCVCVFVCVCVYTECIFNGPSKSVMKAFLDYTQ